MLLAKDAPERFGTAMKTLCNAFSRYFDRALCDAYLIALGDCEISEVEASVRKAIQTMERMPPPATLRNLGRPPLKSTHYAYGHQPGECWSMLLDGEEIRIGWPADAGPEHCVWKEGESEWKPITTDMRSRLTPVSSS